MLSGDNNDKDIIGNIILIIIQKAEPPTASFTQRQT